MVEPGGSVDKASRGHDSEGEAKGEAVADVGSNVVSGGIETSTGSSLPGCWSNEGWTKNRKLSRLLTREASQAAQAEANAASM